MTDHGHTNQSSWTCNGIEYTRYWCPVYGGWLGKAHRPDDDLPRLQGDYCPITRSTEEVYAEAGRRAAKAFLGAFDAAVADAKARGPQINSESKA